MKKLYANCIIAALAAWLVQEARCKILAKFEHKDERWHIVQDEDMRTFFFNVDRDESTWSDPRENIPAKSILVVMVTFLPVALLVLFGYGFYLYMAAYHPEQLKRKPKTYRKRLWH